MFYELLFALTGFPGDVFRQSIQTSIRPATFTLARDISAHPAERTLLDRLAELGIHVRRFRAFLFSQSSLAISPTCPSLEDGRQLFVEWLSMILEKYYGSVGEIEDDYIKAKITPPVTYLSSLFASYFELFQAIERIIVALEQKDNGNMHPLDIVAVEYLNSTPATKPRIYECWTMLTKSFVRELAEWMDTSLLEADNMAGMFPKLVYEDETNIAVSIKTQQAWLVKYAQCSFDKPWATTQGLDPSLDPHAFTAALAASLCSAYVKSSIEIHYILLKECNLASAHTELYLLGHGELWSLLFDLLEDEPRLGSHVSPSGKEVLESVHFRILVLRLLFEQALTDSATSVLLKGASLTLSTALDPEALALEGVRIKLETSQALEILFSADILRQYHDLWEFLIKVKRCETKLQSAWRALKRREKYAANSCRGLSVAIYRVYKFIAQVYSYCQMDVVQVQSMKLIAGLELTKDLGDLREKLFACLEILCQQLFRTIKPLRDALDQILDSAWAIAYCLFSSDRKRLCGYFDDFNGNAQCLFRTLHGMQGHSERHELGKFLLCLDVDDFHLRDLDYHV